MLDVFSYDLWDQLLGKKNQEIKMKYNFSCMWKFSEGINICFTSELWENKCLQTSLLVLAGS